MMRKIVMFPTDNGSWKNVHLLKEIGLIPYYFMKELKYDAWIISGNYAPYDYLDKYLSGVNMHILEVNTEESRLTYIKNNSYDIDLLIMSGVYNGNLEVAKLYKEHNPDGKIWLLLDMNIAFADYLFYEHPELKQFGEYCDLFTVTSRRMQRFLNYKWEWPIYYFPHSFYHELYHYTPTDYVEKDNTIISVGRLGGWQKGTDVLLSAFALVAESIPDWNIKLIGNIDDDFRPFLNEYFNVNPNLKNRIVFTGRIDNKEILVSEYTRAKVFALPSRMEGGMANVMSEAMRSGCAMLVTKFEAYDEAINDNTTGLASEIDDISGYANNMLELCLDSNLESVCNNAYEYAITHFDMNRNIRLADKLIFGE